MVSMIRSGYRFDGSAGQRDVEWELIASRWEGERGERPGQRQGLLPLQGI